ncbi:MAG: class I SAM-dependent methyltransferase [Deltaproteobacteria bacterium]|nr:class I SAM-dependent methyltransferase [Deltaproteobacteria bacterium]
MTEHLSERQKAEKTYHDDRYRNKSADAPIGGIDAAYGFYWRIIGGVKGLKILDYGCGNGWLSVQLAKAGADVCGIDISGELIKKANDLKAKHGLSSNPIFHEMPAENLTFPDAYFDVIAGSAVLHHTELDAALKNIARVLKPGGRAVFIEPMNQNILLKIWRALTPRRRSKTERALGATELRLIKGAFPNVRFHFFDFSTIAAHGLLAVAPKNKILLSFKRLLDRADTVILKAAPWLGKYCAVVVLELR